MLVPQLCLLHPLPAARQHHRQARARFGRLKPGFACGQAASIRRRQLTLRTMVFCCRGTTGICPGCCGGSTACCWRLSCATNSMSPACLPTGLTLLLCVVVGPEWPLLRLRLVATLCNYYRWAHVRGRRTKRMLMRLPPRQPSLAGMMEAIAPRSCMEAVCNERLETLGDAFLKYAVSLHLFNSFPQVWPLISHDGTYADAAADTLDNP